MYMHVCLFNKQLELPLLSFPVTAPPAVLQIELFDMCFVMWPSISASVCLQIQREYGQIGIKVFLACCQSKSVGIARKETLQ